MKKLELIQLYKKRTKIKILKILKVSYSLEQKNMIE